MSLDGSTRYAGFWLRCAASLVDTVIFVLLIVVTSMLFGLGMPTQLGMSATGTDTLLRFTLENLLPATITLFFWIKFLGTPGKLLCGCQVVDANSGGPLRAGQALLRYLGYFISTLPLGLGFLWIAWDKRKQGFHDKIAKTVVILEAPARAPLPDIGKEFRCCCPPWHWPVSKARSTVICSSIALRSRALRRSPAKSSRSNCAAWNSLCICCPMPAIVSATTPNAWRRGCGGCNPGSFPALGRDDRRATFPAGRRSVRMLMFRPRQLLRLLYINNVLLRHGLDDVVGASHLFRPVRFVRYFLPWLWFRRELPPRGVCIRRALEELGPIFIKFGQMLSTRPDLVPEDIVIELARLQDRVPPFPGVQARRIIEATLGRPVAELFATFDETPHASASIAQVHLATLHDGREVVVKVVRPGILDTIARDIDLLYTVAALAERYRREGKRLRPREEMREYEKTIVAELDLMRAAANASQLRRNFQNSEILYVPEVYWPLTRKPVMV